MVLGGGPPGSVLVTRRDFLRIRPLRDSRAERSRSQLRSARLTVSNDHSVSCRSHSELPLDAHITTAGRGVHGVSKGKELLTFLGFVFVVGIVQRDERRRHGICVIRGGTATAGPAIGAEASAQPPVHPADHLELSVTSRTRSTTARTPAISAAS